MKPFKKKGRRVVIFEFSEELIADMLHFPRGVRVCGMWPNLERRCIDIRLEPSDKGAMHAYFPIVAPGEAIPRKNIFGREFPDKYRIEVDFRWWFVGWVESKWSEIKSRFSKSSS